MMRYVIILYFIDNNGPLSGKSIVMENLRQICLYVLNNETWWDYAVEFGEKYLNRSDLRNCSEHIYTDKGFKKMDVDACVKEALKTGTMFRVIIRFWRKKESFSWEKEFRHGLRSESMMSLLE